MIKVGSAAALLWRAPTGLGLPVVKVLADGTYLAVLIDPKVRGARRRAAIIAAARDGADLADEPAHLVRVIEYDVPDREGNGTGELIVLLSTITDPAAARADELAAAYHQRWEEETANDQLKTHLRGPGRILRSAITGAGPPGDLGLAAGPPRVIADDTAEGNRSSLLPCEPASSSCTKWRHPCPCQPPRDDRHGPGMDLAYRAPRGQVNA